VQKRMNRSWADSCEPKEPTTIRWGPDRGKGHNDATFSKLLRTIILFFRTLTSLFITIVRFGFSASVAGNNEVYPRFFRGRGHTEFESKMLCGEITNA